MGKIRRGGYVFLCWKGDHGPKHVHVYRNGRLLVKWDIEAEQPMKGQMTRRVREILREMQAEGFVLRVADPEFVRRTRVMPFVHSATAMPLVVDIGGSFRMTACASSAATRTGLAPGNG